jgi:Peptidase A4 family
LASVFKRAFSRPWNYTQPELVVDPTINALRSGPAVNSPQATGVCAPQPSHGFVMLGNSRTGQAVPVGISPQPGETANGPSAEWIVEAITPLTPAFSPLTFFSCFAGNQNSSVGLTGATLLDRPDASGNDEVKTTIVSSSSVTIQWEAFQ